MTQPLVLRILRPLLRLTCGATAITLWLLVSGQAGSGRTALDCVAILAFTCYTLFAFDPSRIRAVWAKYILTLSGLAGIAAHLVRLMLHLGWTAPSKHVAYNLHLTLRDTNWLLLLAIFALIVSGQLLGIKRKDHEKKQKTTD